MVMNRRLALALAASLVSAALFACQPENGPGGGQIVPPTHTPKPNPAFPSSMAALGDSITAGVGSCFSLEACQRYSWATGDDAGVASHYRRIQESNFAIA